MRRIKIKMSTSFLFALLGVGSLGNAQTVVQGFVRDVNFPYRLADKDNVFAVVKQSSGTALITVGLKF